MDTTYTVYLPDGTKTEHTVSGWGDEPGYDDICKVVLPILHKTRPQAELEHVTVLHDGERRDMFVDEMGMLVGLPINVEATKIYRCNALKHNPSGNPDDLPFIYGPAVLFGRRVWF